MTKNLVSIITPCYNTSKYIPRLLDSILSQDYPFIEMIIVDDGSTDNTWDVINSYKDKFEKKGYNLQCLRQNNLGQSAAINRALKLVKGEYIAWPDSDDWYNSQSTITKLVNDLKDLPEDYGESRCLPTYVSENNFHNNHDLSILPIHLEEQQFEYCLNAYNFIFEPGNYLIRTKVLDEVIPGREIYTEKMAGQNWQIHLPILYKYKCHTIPEYLFCVLEREDSHSRGQFKKPEQIFVKFNSYYNTLIATLDNMLIPSIYKNTYKSHIHEKYLNLLFITACKYSLYEEALMCIERMDKEKVNKPSFSKFRLYLAKHASINNFTRRLYSKSRNLLHIH